MKREGILHPGLLSLLAGAGHGDVVVFTDAGLKIPPHARRIDLALRPGSPSMVQVLEVVLPEFVAEGAIVAEEMSSWNPELELELTRLLPFVPRQLPRARFAEELANTAFGYVKTGECTAFANVALFAGVSFFETAVAHKAEIEARARDGGQLHPRP